eukprot:NODE_7421_length_186_cov_12.328467_g6750_i0.p3 GENE.NODE_7421_length_186_cov_12.328467_g6750_i0~~NODE_7421_length_186_cov_12.328467_g6750_i0.p3  ORF type:complete len:55 (-),score=10.00 NODE_7421_length_186_cov_12.328467_g6750_i0:21-161(-)
MSPPKTVSDRLEVKIGVSESCSGLDCAYFRPLGDPQNILPVPCTLR